MKQQLVPLGMIRSSAARRHGALLCALLLAALLGPCSASATLPGPGAEAEKMLRAAAQSLGWPANVSAASDLAGNAWQISPGYPAGGPTLRAAVVELAPGDAPSFLDGFAQQGMARGVYHGWEAIIARAGDRICDAASGQADSCRQPHGLIAWRSGGYGFLAEDKTGGGSEASIAEALHAASSAKALYRLGSTLVILAQASGVRGRESLAHYRTLAAEVNRYYALNGYGRVRFDYVFLDADGAQGSADWYELGNPTSGQVEDGYAYGVAALRAALASVGLPKVVALERAIVVFPGEGKGGNGLPALRAGTYWLRDDETVEIRGPQGTTTLCLRNLILIAEEERLGTWAHELGHTLHSKEAGDGGFQRLSDRYDYGQAGRRYGSNSPWDLLGGGSRWGIPESSSPTHMASYTKVAAGWLRYRRAVLGQDTVLTALEHQEMGTSVLRLDDPLSADPRCYYVLEARDHDAPYGAPASGVMIYHITYDRGAGHAVVESLPCQSRDGLAIALSLLSEPITLFDVGGLADAEEYIIPGGLRVRLLAESFGPYRATVRIERYSAARQP